MTRPLPLVFASLLLLAACGGGGSQLNLFTWSGYLDREVLEAFEKEHGCTVVESNFESNEDLRAKLQIANAGYDLVCPSDYCVTQLVADGLLLEIDPARIPNLRNIAPEFRDPPYDRGMRHSVPFQWGVTGIGFLRRRVEWAPTSWSDLFDPARSVQYKGALGLLDDGREVVGAALLSLGFDPNTHDPAQIAAARARLVALKPLVAAFDSSDFQNTLSQGQTVMAQGWNGQFAGARRDNPAVEFVVPKEGAFRYVDNWAIPKGAPHRALAESFIDYMLRADVAAKLGNAKLYASPNEAARKLVDPAVLSGMSYDVGAVGTKLYAMEVLPDDVAKLYADAFAAMKAE